MGTKQDPGKYDAYMKAEMDEPMFVLLARDPLAHLLVEHWVRLRQAMDFSSDTQEKMLEALECARQMREWASDHPDHGPMAPK